MKLCLNMIVRNEATIIERCLASVADHIACYVIADTGSTDGTQEKIREFFRLRGIEGEIVEVPFIDFSQARNAALLAAERSTFEFDYLLLVDADMELVVTDAAFAEGLTEPGYMAPQKAGGLYYLNVRLARRGAGARYVGPTHEYLDLPKDTPVLRGLEFIDHACGSNRAEKFERDARLLTAALERDPDNARNVFYLAQTLFHGGKVEEAMPLYARRAKMGDFEEEAWFAALAEALCERDLGNTEAFLAKALGAWQRRPHRGEPLYHLAAHAVKEGKHPLACLLCEEGLRLSFPSGDRLFIEPWVYDWGFDYILSISGFYDPSRRARAFGANNSLSLTRRFPANVRAMAAMNVVHYLAPVSTYLESWQARPIDFQPPEGWHATNPCIANAVGSADCIVRAVNYRIEFGPEGACYVTPPGEPIRTRNWLLCLSDALDTVEAVEIDRPENMPPPLYNGIQGFEDLRIAHHNGEICVSGTICETTEDGHRNMILAKIDLANGARLIDWHIVEPDTPKQHEKNWAPLEWNGELAYLYSFDPIRIVSQDGQTIYLAPSPIDASRFRGGSQLVPFEGGWLCVVHEVHVSPRSHNRTYYHRFVSFDDFYQMRRVSPPFVFNHPRIEFCAGLAWVGGRLAASYGVDDCEAWIGTFDPVDLSEFLIDVSEFS